MVTLVFWYMFSEPNLTTYHSNIGVQIRPLIEASMSTLVQDEYQIQIMLETICFIIFGAHMNILLNVKVEILVLIKWSYRPPPNHVDYWA